MEHRLQTFSKIFPSFSRYDEFTTRAKKIWTKNKNKKHQSERSELKGKTWSISDLTLLLLFFKELIEAKEEKEMYVNKFSLYILSMNE